MSVTITKRDYSLIGRDTKLAEERGLASAEWYASPIPRARLKELMRRRDGPAIRDTLIWFAALAATALPALHAEMKADTPTPYAGLWEAYREIIPALLQQVKDPTYYVVRQLPSSTRPVTAPMPGE